METYCRWSEETVTENYDSTFQSSAQRDFVIMATRTPQKEESTAAGGNSLDKEWVTEHARQVGRGDSSKPIHFHTYIHTRIAPSIDFIT